MNCLYRKVHDYFFVGLLVVSQSAVAQMSPRGERILGNSVILAGGVLSTIGALTVTSANMSDENNRYYEQCHGEKSCEQRHYRNDMRFGQYSFWTGVTTLGVGLGIRIFKPFSKTEDDKAVEIFMSPTMIGVAKNF